MTGATLGQAVDDMVAATGLLSDASLGPDLDEVMHLARYKRGQAGFAPVEK